MRKPKPAHVARRERREAQDMRRLLALPEARDLVRRLDSRLEVGGTRYMMRRSRR